MAQKTNSNTFVSCMNCKWADLMQWFENPIVAQCNKRGDRQVAATRRICKEYSERTTESTITHFDHYEDED